MKAITVKVSNRGYIVLPAPLRKALEIKPGSRILLSRKNDRLILTPVQPLLVNLAVSFNGVFLFVVCGIIRMTCKQALLYAYRVR